MKVAVERFTVRTRGKGTQELTEAVGRIVAGSGVREGIAAVFLQHTSASLVLFENADPTARLDLERYFERIAPPDPAFAHSMEGPDDMPSHLKMVLSGASLTIPVQGGRMLLGTWQGIFLFEHREAPHERTVAVSVLGI
jgi:secondary thiamine-phosphate synthase enzyme